MNGSPFPIAKALALAACLAIVHFVVAHILLFAAVSGLFPPGILGFEILSLPLIAAIPDLFSRPHVVASLLNSLAYGLVAAWAWCFARWSRRTKDASLWDARLGTALVAFAALALLIGEFGHPVTGPEDARLEAIALRRAEAAEATAENLRKGVAYNERVAADESRTPYIRELHAGNAREEAAKVEKEEQRARSERAEAAHYARGKLRPGTRYPALVLMALGASLGWIARRRRRRSENAFADDVA